MSKKNVSFLELFESERAKVAGEAKTILRQQMEKARLGRPVAESCEARVRSEGQKSS